MLFFMFSMEWIFHFFDNYFPRGKYPTCGRIARKMRLFGGICVNDASRTRHFQVNSFIMCMAVTSWLQHYFVFMVRVIVYVSTGGWEGERGRENFDVIFIFWSPWQERPWLRVYRANLISTIYQTNVRTCSATYTSILFDVVKKKSSNKFQKKSTYLRLPAMILLG